jgi:peptidoglycan/xylan/chitin deacetylase (PgdA/CDA1 family)
VPAVTRARWAPGNTTAVMLSFDFDGESGWLAGDPDNYRRAGLVSQGTYGPKVGIYKVLEVLADEGVKATFFTPGWIIDHRTAAVQAIVDGGHEVAHHGDLHRSIQPGDEAAEVAELDRAIETFQLRLGITPVGYRAPYGDISLNLIELLAERGFTYDSSLMDDARPYRHTLASGSAGPVELPWHWSLSDATYLLTSGQNLLPISSNEQVQSIWNKELEGAHEWSGFIDVLMHPQFIGRPSRLFILRDFIRYAKTLDGVWFATGAEIASSWLEHNADEPAPTVTPFGLDYR